MSCSQATIDAAIAMAQRDPALMGVLRNWHMREGRLCRETADKAFDQWLHGLLDYLSDQLGAVEPTPANLVQALEVNAVGDKLALYLASQMQREHGLFTDTNCYVEEGVIFASVWLCGELAAFVSGYAEEVANCFRQAGYAAEIWIDEEDDKKVTVNAQIDFAPSDLV